MYIHIYECKLYIYTICQYILSSLAVYIFLWAFLSYLDGINTLCAISDVKLVFCSLCCIYLSVQLCFTCTLTSSLWVLYPKNKANTQYYYLLHYHSIAAAVLYNSSAAFLTLLTSETRIPYSDVFVA